MTFNGFLRDPANPGVFYAGPLLDSDGAFFIPVEAETTPVAFSWNGIEFSTASPFKPRRVSGWDNPPDGDASDEPVAGRHGSRRTRVIRRRRVVEIEGSCTTRSARDYLFQMLGDAMADGFGDGDETSTLVGSVAGRELTAEAQLLRYQPTIETLPWGKGVWTWALQFICPNPMRYGPKQTVTVPITVPTLGITVPITGDWVFPEDPVGGIAVVSNDGNALADGVYTLEGPLLGPGVALIDTDEHVDFDFDLGAGDVLTIDTATGVCSLNGEYRAPSVNSSLLDEMRLPSKTRSTVQALGTPQPGSPSLSVSVLPTYW